MKKWLMTFTKNWVRIILIVAIVDMQLSYLLAFLGREQIAETLSTTVATTIIGVMLGYFGKALFETFLEKREERLRKVLKIEDPIASTEESAEPESPEVNNDVNG